MAYKYITSKNRHFGIKRSVCDCCNETNRKVRCEHGVIKMRRSHHNTTPWQIYTSLLVLILMTGPKGVGGLRDVKMEVPDAVSPGDTITLRCSYDLEGEPLYSVKWYKGRQEFFRYVPKELPHTRVFPLKGINVDVSRSGANQVVLQDVQLELAGKYRCEVSADAPTFDTGMVGKYMHVAYLPESDPKVTAEKQRYSVGETLRANCTSPASTPPTNLTWFINGKMYNASYKRLLKEYPEQPRKRQVTLIGLELEIDGGMFQYGKIRLQCVATMFSLYRSEVAIQLEEEKPRLASVLGTRESSLGCAIRWQCIWWLLPAVVLLPFFAR